MPAIVDVEGLKYHVLFSSDEIREFISSVLEKEWAWDKEDDPLWQENDRKTLALIKRLEWAPIRVPLFVFKIDNRIMEGPKYKAQFVKRVEFQRNRIKQGGPIEPLAILKDGTGIDGYHRFFALKAEGYSTTIAYVGSKMVERGGFEPPKPFGSGF